MSRNEDWILFKSPTSLTLCAYKSCEAVSQQEQTLDPATLKNEILESESCCFFS